MKTSQSGWVLLLGACLLPGALGCGAVAGGSPSASSATQNLSLGAALAGAREARCATAICFGGEGNSQYALEPVAELPIGKTFTLWDRTSLGTFINNHEVSAELTAGLRFWFAYDIASLSVYLSKPLLGTEDRIRVSGSPYEQPVSRIKRPYPGLALGLFGDVLWIGMDINELHNGSSDGDRDPRYPRDGVIGRSLTWTVALTPITTARNAIGAAKGKSGPGGTQQAPGARAGSQPPGAATDPAAPNPAIPGQTQQAPAAAPATTADQTRQAPTATPATTSTEAPSTPPALPPQ